MICSKNQNLSQISPAKLASRGYLPEVLPPCFDSTDLGLFVSNLPQWKIESLLKPKGIKKKSITIDPVDIYGARYGGLLRKYSVPAPLPFIQLSLELARSREDIQNHQNANHCYFEEGIRILELSRRAAELYTAQDSFEKRKLLELVLSNCTWKGGKLRVKYNQPFDLIAKTATRAREKEAKFGLEKAKK